MRKSLLLMVLVSAVVLSACGKNHVSKQEAKDGWKTTSQTLSAGAGEVYSASVSASSSDDGGTLTVDFSCPEGGTATFTGSYSASDDGSGALAANADLGIDYKACTADGTTIDGDLNFGIETTSDGSNATTKFDYDGELDWTGEVNGNCVIDMTGKASANSSSFSISYSGSICGYDADRHLNSFSFSTG